MSSKAYELWPVPVESLLGEPVGGHGHETCCLFGCEEFVVLQSSGHDAQLLIMLYLTWDLVLLSFAAALIGGIFMRLRNRAWMDEFLGVVFRQLLQFRQA